jgi:hypothetical protein
VVGKPKTIDRMYASRSRIAALSAVLLLLAQLIAAGHVHPWAFRNTFSNSTEPVSDAVCPICLFHAHVPFGGTTAPVLARPLAGESFVAIALPSRLLVIPKSQLYGRAPPASI